MALGPQARFYHSLTEEEVQRLEKILQNDEAMYETTEEAPQEPEDSVETLPETARAAFVPRRRDIEALTRIDSQLSLFIPEELWDVKSITYAPSVAPSGMQTPVSVRAWPKSSGQLPAAAKSPTTSVRRGKAGCLTALDIDDVMNDTNLTHSIPAGDVDRLKEIDKQLQDLKERSETAPEAIHAIPESVLKTLLEEALASSSFGSNI
ncbi:hypothetical protein HDV03_001902 [Kappamyces sp. JEL0829]|nr:hypothetical protein HDV03_001902 [Kappamyces sp. JEL0829]